MDVDYDGARIAAFAWLVLPLGVIVFLAVKILLEKLPRSK